MIFILLFAYLLFLAVGIALHFFVLSAMVVAFLLFAIWEYVLPERAREAIDRGWRHSAARVTRIAAVFLCISFGYSWIFSKGDDMEVVAWWLAEWSSGDRFGLGIMAVGAASTTLVVFADT